MPNIMIPTPGEMISLLSQRVIGQDEAKRVVAVAAYQHFLNCAKADLLGGRVEAENHVMLIGNTGSGKSMLLKNLQRILQCPGFFVSCTNITPDGYKGKNFVQHLDSIASELVDEGVTKPAIVVWDECDKLAIQGNNQAVESANIYRRITQTEFLTYLDGIKCGSDGDLDSSRILNIAIGAFVGLDAIRNPTARPSMGFHQALTADEKKATRQPITPEQLISYGLIPEFVGRFSRIASLDALDGTALRRILMEAEGNVLARRKEFFALHGITLEITDDAIDELIRMAMSLGTGGRALRVVVDRMLRSVEHRLPDMAHDGIHTLIFNRATIRGSAHPIELRGEPIQPTQLLELRRHAAYPAHKPKNHKDEDDPCLM